MNLLRGLTRPYYLFRPSQIWQRLKFGFEKPARACWVNLPWQLKMWADPVDDLGHALRTAGVNDLMVSESLYRLAEPGELAVDVGANVGYTTGILALRTSVAGRVVSFEPHPALYQELCSNLGRWHSARTDLARVETVNCAVSEQTGEAVLNEPAEFSSNKGRSSLQVQDMDGGKARALKVATVSLDSRFSGCESIGVLKVDVEGHEAHVFAGAKILLDTGRIRDILFEEFAPYPANSHQMLEAHGFVIFALEEGLAGPSLFPPNPNWKRPKYSPPNYVATLDVERLRQKFRPRGWQCLSARNNQC